MSINQEALELAVQDAWELSCRRPMAFDVAVRIMAGRYGISESAIHQEAFRSYLDACERDPSLAEN